MSMNNYNTIYKIDANGNKKRFCNVERSPFSDYHNRIRKSIEFHGYIYRFMSKEEYNKYMNHSLKDCNTEWYDNTSDRLIYHNGHASYNKGYCFFGETCYTSESLEYLIDNTHNLNNADGFKRDGYILNKCEASSNEYRHNIEYIRFYDELGITDRRMNILCKFKYDGIIDKSIGVYIRRGWEGDPDDISYLEEYGLPNYNDLKLVDAIFYDPHETCWTVDDESKYKELKEEEDDE